MKDNLTQNFSKKDNVQNSAPKIVAFHAPIKNFLKLNDDAKTAIVTLAIPLDSIQANEVWVRSEPDNEERLNSLKKVEISKVHSDTSSSTNYATDWNYWQGELTLNQAEQTTLYCFKIHYDTINSTTNSTTTLNSTSTLWLSALGSHKFFPEREYHFNLNPSYQAANWVWSQVFYQIFPERFYDGDSSNNPVVDEYLYEDKAILIKTWDELPHQESGPREFFGGDLQGIIQKLDYIQELGATALYLNPIFTSHSSHKYDTVDYYNVDPHFGGNDAFIDLRTETKKRNMRIMLDAVVNHTSDRHAWMDRYDEHPENGAYQSEDAETREFYTFEDKDDPESYSGWLGFIKTLPVLDFANENLQKVMYKNDSQDSPAILRHWLRPPYNIDAWRFDVIHMLGEGTGAKNNAHYVREFRKAVREENNEAYVLGEHFFEATKWLQGDQEDGAMNYYGFARPVWNFLAKEDFRGDAIEVDAKDFDWLLGRARARLPFPIQLSQFNLLDSHDTPRMLTRLNEDQALMKCAVTLLMTYIGVPCIYYGDEIGLTGGGDPYCRAPMPWPELTENEITGDETKWNNDLLGHYKILASFRHNNLVMQEGAFLSLYAEKDIYAFARILDSTTVLTIINRGMYNTIRLPIWKAALSTGYFESILDNQSLEYADGYLNIELAEKSAFVLKVVTT